MKRLVFTVTNDLNYDQRMIRICTSCHKAGYSVLLVGRKKRASTLLADRAFRQRRIACLFETGPLFYLEYNVKLFFFLLFQPLDLICAVDLDTILPCIAVSGLRKKRKIYDAHELFTEMKEVVSRPHIRKLWKQIERLAVPWFKYAYTVNDEIAALFKQEYGVTFGVIRNIPSLESVAPVQPEPFIIYQGAVNHGRSFETLIPAFVHIAVPLHIYGEGNFLNEAQALVRKYQLEHKIFFKGLAAPEILRQVTPRALLGITLFENNGLSNYYSLANRFFDYIHAAVPQICVNFPVYRSINAKFTIGVLVDDLGSESLANAINTILSNPQLYQDLKENCLRAREMYNWQSEEKTLLLFYKKIFA
ncbi:MAG: glycosyltransferase [Chitinophagaceae bacterium]